MSAAGQPRRFATVDAYNVAHPGRRMPSEAPERHRLRGFHAAMAGVEDDLTGSGASLTIDFLPGGAPRPGEEDRLGNVVASHWGQAPIVVLAEEVSLREAWRAITGSWPARLSQARQILADLRADARPAPAG
ncbi:hypothetical protein B0I33_1153 [Prauserella shujinwangii]|uniref:Uncharacterized protein n=2 Tax=Prauserella shujinwangii TaxID=1453103 RepID=A0A2T0LKG3_9PSEU|nr:hypothetical protein B0I33_1153 [Prauserella shujinwangii]